jgi:hypothetical protein
MRRFTFISFCAAALVVAYGSTAAAQARLAAPVDHAEANSTPSTRGAAQASAAERGAVNLVGFDAPVPSLDAPFFRYPLPRIKPGTIVRDAAPEGWSRLIFKSRPKVVAGDVEKVAASTLKLVSKFATTVLLRTDRHPQSGQFRLASVAIGAAAAASTHDVIVTQDTAESLGVRLGMFDTVALTECDARFQKVVQAARSETMAVVDFPTVVLLDDEHVDAVFRHAYFVDPRDGNTFALVWLLEPVGKTFRLRGEMMSLLPPNQVIDWPLRVDTTKFFLGAPSPEAFAAVSLPPGTPIEMPDELTPIAAAPALSPNSAHRLEVGLWRVLFAAPR